MRRPRICRKKLMEMKLPGKGKRGRPKRRFLDVVKENMGEVGAREKDIFKQDAVKEHHTLWQPLIKEKGQKKKIVK